MAEKSPLFEEVSLEEPNQMARDASKEVVLCATVRIGGASLPTWNGIIIFDLKCLVAFSKRLILHTGNLYYFMRIIRGGLVAVTCPGIPPPLPDSSQKNKILYATLIVLGWCVQNSLCLMTLQRLNIQLMLPFFSTIANSGHKLCTRGYSRCCTTTSNSCQ